MGFFEDLKARLGKWSPAPAPAKVEADTSPFQPGPDHPLAREHAMIAGSFQQGSYSVSSDTLERFKRLPAEEARRVAEAVIEYMLDQEVKTAALKKTGADYKVIEPLTHRAYPLRTLLEHGVWHGLPVSDPALLQWLEWSVSVYQLIPSYDVNRLFQMAEWCEGAVSRMGNTQPHLGRLEQLCRRFLEASNVRRDHWKRLRAFRDRLGMTPEIHLGEKRRWSRRVTKDFESMPPATRLAWTRLFEYLEDSSAAEPSDKWLAGAKEVLAAPELANWETQLEVWLSAFCLPREEGQSEVGEENSAVLKGMGWLCTLAKSPELSRMIPKCAVAAYQDISNVAIVAAAVGNGFINALGLRADAASLEQLALLRTKIKRPQAQKCLEKALKLAARKTGSTPQEIAEANVPEYGMTDVGVLQKELGGFTARLTAVNSQSIEIEWTDSARKVLRSAPKAGELAGDIKTLKAAAKDIQKMLAAQVARLEAVYLEQRSWDFAAWRRHYLDHRLVGILARRLIWNFTTGDQTQAALWHEGQLVGVDGSPIATSESTTVTLWHPLNVAADVVLGWRNRLEASGCTQPFKQAYREVYLLTPAEARTNVYSNRFAGHILKQHQFHALAVGRGWKHAYRMPFGDGGSDAKRDLPEWKLRAEFWVGGVGEETSDSGMFLYLSTDQVRFHRLQGRSVEPEPLPLSEIPPVVFSEVMRDVDLFVGVASVGNDAAWRDSGGLPQGREYWNKFAFGDLSATAQTRREVLQKLVPRLKIAAQCSFEDKFLVVRGKLRSYKIHLGSGNILMSPNDRYLCIVESRGKAETGNLFLPFEGDSVLSLVISKALLLAADDKISDPTIVQQIRD